MRRLVTSEVTGKSGYIRYVDQGLLTMWKARRYAINTQGLHHDFDERMFAPFAGKGVTLLFAPLRTIASEQSDIPH